MATVNRTAQLNKAHKVLKKHFKPVSPNPDRPVLEQLLFACCLENGAYEPAEEVFARLGETFFDWNEVRVSTVPELSLVMKGLHDEREAATRLKRVLQGVFEATYSFDLEFLRKMNLGQAIQKLQKMTASSPFAASYVTQASLGGHSIPIDRGAAWVCEILGIIGPAELEACTVQGIDRAIPKNKGIEFGSLLHQFGAQLVASPLSPAVHKILLEIDSGCRDRLPKRQVKKKPEPPAPPPKASAAAKKLPAKGGKEASPPHKEAPRPAPHADHSAKDKAAKDRDSKAKLPAGKPLPHKAEAAKKPEPKKAKPVAPPKKKAAVAKSRGTANLAKRKPR